MIGAVVKPKATLRLCICTQQAILFLLPGGTLELCCEIQVIQIKAQMKNSQ